MAKKGKMKISKLKRNNQTTNKMQKSGKMRTQRHQGRQVSRPRPTAAPPEHSDASSESAGDDDMGDDEELQYFRQQLARNSALLSSVPTEDEKPQEKDGPGKRKRKKGSRAEEGVQEDACEERYAEVARAGAAAGEGGGKRLKPLLPIKTRDGILQRAEEKEESDDDELPEETFLESDAMDPPSEGEEEMGVGSVVPAALGDQPEMSAADLLVARQLQLRSDKFRIGTLCSGLLESPEKKLRNFYPLFMLMDEKTKDGAQNLVSTRKLAMVSVCEVFKDILPEYQLRHQDYSDVKLKKDTLAMYKHEKELLELYKRFLQRLEKAAGALRRKKGDGRGADSGARRLGALAVRCLCAVLGARPHFNFAANICQAVVPFLNSTDAEARAAVHQCCRDIFAEDKKGEISLTLVRRINHLVKSRANNVRPEALTCLLTLRIRDVDLDAERELQVKKQKEEQRKKRLINLSKKEKKRRKKLVEVEREMLETAGAESQRGRLQHLADVTRTVFNIYFRVLKSSPHSRLLGATLEGLSKFTHVINLEYYSDLVSILDRLLDKELVAGRQRLNCVRTVFSVLSGQGDALNVDPSKFYAHLYRSLLTIHAGRSLEDLPVLLDTLECVLVQRRRRVSAQVLLALVKRLGALAMQVMPNGALGCLALIRTVAQNTKAVESLLQAEDSVGSGRYDPLLEEPEHCAAHAASLFEAVRLRRHYHPAVRRAAAHLAAGAPASGEGALPVDLSKLTVKQLYKEYDGSQMAFKPAVPPPPANINRKRGAPTHTFLLPAFQEYCERHLNAVPTDLNCQSLFISPTTKVVK